MGGIVRDLFPGFYPPTAQEYEKISKESLVVFDANSLLDLYRLPASARDEFLEVLAGLKDRLWIPFQVALEFQRNRLTVITDERKVTQDALDSAKELVEKLTQKVEDLELDKHGLGLKPDELIKDLKNSNQKLQEALTKVHEARLDPGHKDEIRDRLDKILKGKVGSPPSTQAEMDQLVAGGDQRFSDRIPPGFADVDKGKDPTKASYVHNGIKYTAKFGDLILWRQLISYVKAEKPKSVLFVTRDRKEDWWWSEKGKTLGPSPELVSEIKRETGVELFWMYRPDQFLEMAKTNDIAKVSSSSVDEVKALKSRWEEIFQSSNGLIPLTFRPLTTSRIEDIVLAYLENRFDELEVNPSGFPDAFAFDEASGLKFAVEIMSPGRAGGPSHFLEEAKSKIIVVQDLIDKGVAAGFVLACVVPSRIADQFVNSLERLRDVISAYPLTELVVGEIVDDAFQPLLRIGNNDLK
ncbi:PIN-like domain-containing protein [Rhizobium anhuiense]|uniref:PIN like domain-containing protein n=1 Tax=Rhizobium anhuiense TaxID=1184720 RepID=A0A432NV27_9HYPH|nr:PIN-like domain-containing protein [Rhizobium anhuiense]RUM03482.1 hypothetical protein EEQ99_09930 [Rhizobium anhuiense]GGD60260.1 hypothetical protein GCM10008012_01050 [Rhizobium anhuiense]